MQPTDHKHKNDEELIAHIKNSLKVHEELYQLGAWERFNEQQQTKKRPFFWIVSLSGAAAVLAVCISLIWFSNGTPQNEQLVKTESLKKVEAPKYQLPNNRTEGLESTQIANASAETSRLSNKKLIASMDNEHVTAIKQVVETIEPGSPIISNVDQSIVAAPIAAANTAIDNQSAIVPADEKINTSDFLASESQKNARKLDKLTMNKKQSKWDMGLMLAPSFGNARELNMGYGVSMSYNFSDKLSLTSGIAYNKMSASKNLPTNIGMSSIVTGNTKSLEMINDEVTGLDIPLELKYNINKNIYANFGVSGFAVLNQSRSNTFVEEVVIKSNGTTSSSNAPSGPDGASSTTDPSGPKGQFANSYIVNQRTTERTTVSAIDDVNYLGFYNFSFGYTKKVYKNHSLSIEPFVKLPIKGATQNNLRLVGTGLRLKVGF